MGGREAGMNQSRFDATVTVCEGLAEVVDSLGELETLPALDPYFAAAMCSRADAKSRASLAA